MRLEPVRLGAFELVANRGDLGRVEEVGPEGTGGEEGTEVLDVEGLVDDPCHLGPDLRAVAQADRLDEELPERLALERDLPEDIEHGAAEGLGLDGDLLEQSGVDVALTGLVRQPGSRGGTARSGRSGGSARTAARSGSGSRAGRS